MTIRAIRVLAAAALLVAGVAAAPRAEEGDGASEAAWARARALADAQRFDEALTTTRAALANDPDNADLLWLEAGIVGWSGRHDESLALFEALIAKHPELADRVRLDVATQRLWADDHRGALAEVEMYLETHPGDRDARRTRALILSFSDRSREARAEYEALLAEDPNDTEARIGYARTLNWAGEHREAKSIYYELWEAGERDPDVSRGLAYAEYWSDRPDRAREPLDRLLARSPDDREGLMLRYKLDRESSLALTFRHSVSEDSDDLRVLANAFDLSCPLGDHDVAFFTAEHVQVKDPGGEHRLRRPGVGHRRIWSDSWTTTERLLLQYQRADTLDDRVLWDVNALFRPTDHLRFEIAVSRDQILTRRALDLGIVVTSGFLGVDLEPAPRWNLHGALRGNDYEDDNRSLLAEGAIAYRVVSRRDLTVTASGDARLLTSRHNLDNGYYDPIRYAEAGPGLAFSWEPRPGWVIEAAGRAGLQKEAGSDTDPFYSTEARVEIPVVDPITIGGDVGRSDSNLSSESGFRRTAWSLFVTARF